LLLACGPAAEETTEAPEWSLSAEPTLVIGEDGTSEGEFERISTVSALPTNEIAVVDAGAQYIRIFGDDGTYRRTIGREGAGPGEFTAISWIQLATDTLVVYDGGQRRLTLLGVDGTVLSTVVPRPEGGVGPATPVILAADGRWFMRLLLLGSAGRLGSGPPEPGILRDSTGFGYLPALGAGPIDLMLRLPAQPIVMGEGGVGGFAAFSAPPGVLRVGTRIVVADPNAGTLRWYGPDGRAEPMIALAVPRRPLAPSLVDSLRLAAVEGTGSAGGKVAMEAMHSSEAAPSEFPLFRSVLADGTDHLWLEEWQYRSAGGSRYLVVGADGSWQASVQMPPGVTPSAVGPDWVLGVHRDADGLGRVVRYGLVRP
jgi:hypothetical protein